MQDFSVKDYTRGKRVPISIFRKVAQHVLPGWEISLVLAGSVRAKQLNIALRGKDYVPNVLSYALSEKSGEIIICPEEAKKQASDFDLTTRAFLILLFIHGTLHLKGMTHGATMERSERTLLKKFSS